MATRNLDIVIKPKADATSVSRVKTALEKTTKELRAQDTVTNALDRAHRRMSTTVERVAKMQAAVFHKARDAGREFVGDLNRAFDEAHRRLDRLGGKLAEMRTRASAAFAARFRGGSGGAGGGGGGGGIDLSGVGTWLLGGAAAAGYGAYKFGRKLFEEGAQQQKTVRRIKREFSGDFDIDALMSNADRIGKRSGLQGDDVLRALTPSLEAINDVQAGSLLKGKKLSASQARDYREAAARRAGSIVERLATLNPDLEPETLGQVVAEAGTGPEGLKRFASMLHINKVKARRITGDVQKGKLTSTEALESLLKESGLTDKAAEDERKTFAFQAKSIQAQLVDKLGDIGSTAIDRLNESLGKGVTLSERLGQYLDSDRGQKMIGTITTGVTGLLDLFAKLALKVPAAFEWLEQHREMFETIGTTLEKAANAVKYVVDKTGKFGEWAGDTTAKVTGFFKGLDHAPNDELDVAKRLAAKVRAGTTSPERAAYEFQGFAKNSEGRSVDDLSGFAQRLREGLRTRDLTAIEGITRDQVAQRASGEAGKTYGQPIINMPITITPTPLDALSTQRLVDHALPQIQRGLASGLHAATAGGLAPAGG